MSSWKVRLLMALTILTMLLTMSAAPAMANIDRFDDPFLGCFDCDHHIDHFNQPFLGCFDCDDEFFDEDFEHVGHPRAVDGLVCAPVRDVDGRFWECWDPRTGELVEF